MTCRTKSVLLDCVTRAVRYHSSDVIILRVSDWSRRKSVRKMIRPKDVIGRDESPSEGWSGRRMWLAYTKVRPWRSSERMPQRLLIGWDEATCPYDNASDLLSCQTDLIGREGELVFSSGTLLIGRSDGLVLLERFLLADLIDLLSASSLFFLLRNFIQP